MIDYEQHNLILKILLSLNSVIISNVLQENNIIKVLIKYNIDKIFYLLKVLLQEKNNNLEISKSNINITYDIISIKFDTDMDNETETETKIEDQFYIYCFSDSFSDMIVQSSIYTSLSGSPTT